MSYIGTEPKDIRSFGRTKFDYTATQGQTAFTGADDDGKVLAFTEGQIEVYVNGILMDDSDFTTTGTGTVTLASAANLNDVINIVSFETNIPDSNYVPASGGTFTGNVTNSGNVTVGGTLGVTGAVTASNGLTVDDAGATPLTVDRATDDGAIIDVQKDGTSVGSIGTYGGDMTVGTGDTRVRFIDSLDCVVPVSDAVGTSRDASVDLGYSSIRYKDLYLSGGVYLGGTNSAHHLDDYEEGEFTYSIVGSSSGGWTNRTGYTKGSYVKIGNTVHIQLRFETTSKGSPSGTYVQITGFPFTNIATSAGGSNNQVQAAINVRGNGQSSDSCGTYGLINNNSAVMSLFIRRSNSSFSFDPIQPNDISGNTEGGVVFTYRTS